MGIGMAMVGWIAENIAMIIFFGVIDSRFHILPFISPYALIIPAFYLAIGDPDDFTFFGLKLFKERSLRNTVLSNIVTIVFIFAAVFFGELATGSALEALFGVELWDYSAQPFALKYAGLIPMLGYGLMAYGILKLIYKPVLDLMQKKMNYKLAKVITLTLGVAIVLDTTFLLIYMGVTGVKPEYWMIRLFSYS